MRYKVNQQESQLIGVWIAESNDKGFYKFVEFFATGIRLDTNGTFKLRGGSGRTRNEYRVAMGHHDDRIYNGANKIPNTIKVSDNGKKLTIFMQGGQTFNGRRPTVKELKMYNDFRNTQLIFRAANYNMLHLMEELLLENPSLRQAKFTHGDLMYYAKLRDSRDSDLLNAATVKYLKNRK